MGAWRPVWAARTLDPPSPRADDAEESPFDAAITSSESQPERYFLPFGLVDPLRTLQANDLLFSPDHHIQSLFLTICIPPSLHGHTDTMCHACLGLKPGGCLWLGADQQGSRSNVPHPRCLVRLQGDHGFRIAFYLGGTRGRESSPPAVGRDQTRDEPLFTSLSSGPGLDELDEGSSLL